jgi:hypothetical protein
MAFKHCDLNHNKCVIRITDYLSGLAYYSINVKFISACIARTEEGYQMVNKKTIFILLVSLIITSLFGCGSGGGTANLNASTSSNGDQTETSATPEGAALTLAWDAPTTNTDGSSLNPTTDLSLYKIYYGTESLTYTTVVDVANPGTPTVSQTLNLLPGTYYFTVTTVDTSGQESSYSNEVMKTI